MKKLEHAGSVARMAMNLTGLHSTQAVIHNPPQFEQKVLQLFQLQQRQLMF